MSESKSRMQKEIWRLEDELSKAHGNVIYLLRALLNIGEANPGIELPELGQNRFSEHTWRQVGC